MAHFPKSCSVDGCNGKVRCKNLCSKHYSRLLVHGSPTGGAPERSNAEEIDAFLERIRTYDGDDCLIWPFATLRSGYPRVNRRGMPRAVHRWACELQNGPAPADKPEAAHECGKGSHGCVTKRHLKWADRIENSADMVAHGNSLRGSKSHRAKISEADVLAIRRLRGRASQREIGESFGISQSAVSLIFRGENWGWLT